MNWLSLGESELQHDLKDCALMGYLLLKPKFSNLSCAIFDYKELSHWHSLGFNNR